MKKKIYGKLLLDLVLFVLLALMYRKRAVSMHFHETGGLVLCGLFLLHKGLNWQWIRTVTVEVFRKRKLNLRWVVDVLLVVSMAAVLITGLAIAKTLPTALENSRAIQPWHYFFAAVALALSGIHLGLHGAYLRNNLWQKLPLPAGARKWLGVLLLCGLFCFGSFQLVNSGFASQFVRPFVSVSAFHEGEGEMGHFGPGQGKGKGQGHGRGMGQGKNRSVEENHGISAASVLSTAGTYGSILGWFAIVTAMLSRIFKRRSNV